MTSKNIKIKAISIFLAATMCFAVLNTFIKIAALGVDPYIIIAYRCGLGALLLGSIIYMSKEIKFVRFHKFNIVKGFIDFVSIPLWVTAMAHLKIGEVVSISYVTPLISTFLAVVFLKERMNKPKLIALTLGVLGVMVIIQPTTEIFNPYSLLVLAACFLWGGTVIFTKKLTKIQHPVVIVFYSNFFAFLISSPFIISRWVVVDMKTTMTLCAIGVVAVLANTLVTKAYKMTDVTNIIPFDYNRLLFSTILGFVVLGEVIEYHTYMGAAIIFSATMYLATVFKGEADEKVEPKKVI